jgi:hypothetical protein
MALWGFSAGFLCFDCAFASWRLILAATGAAALPCRRLRGSVAPTRVREIQHAVMV